jgi:hypothetical protein
MLTSNAKTEGVFEYAGEYYTACNVFLSGTDPSMPSKTLLQPNDLNIGVQKNPATGVQKRAGAGVSEPPAKRPLGRSRKPSEKAAVSQNI